jgi:ABC-type multidrug transport system ATPase subunit
MLHAAHAEQDALTLLAFQAPVAGDLRGVVASLKNVADAERMCALALHVAKIVRRLDDGRQRPHRTARQPRRAPFSVLSGGERRLALMARALVQDTPVLLLDEPTAGLDFSNEARILEVVAGLAQSGRTVPMTTHQPWHALLCGDQAALMGDGRLVGIGPADQIVTASRLSELHGVPVRLLTAADESMERPAYACAPIVGAATKTPRFSWNPSCLKPGAAQRDQRQC